MADNLLLFVGFCFANGMTDSLIYSNILYFQTIGGNHDCQTRS